MTATAAVASVEPGSARAWLMATRPKTLTAAVTPVVVGTACAHVVGAVRPLPALAALVGSMLLQIGSNLANDVYDHEKGADTEERLGPTRTVQAGLLTPRAVRRAMVLVFALALLVGVYLTSVAGPAIVVIGIASIVSAIAYTGGPYPLGYHGLGDLFVMIFFGFVAVCGTVFVQLGTVPELAWWASLPVGSLATAILVVNNVRDRETDVVAGKRTLPVRFGRQMGLWEYRLLFAASYAVPVALVLARGLGPWVLLPLATLPLAVRLERRVSRDAGAVLNQSLEGTAKLLAAHGLLFAVGLVLGGGGG